MSPVTRSQSRRRTARGGENAGDFKDKVLTRVRSVRASIGGIGESFGTLRQKLKKSTQRRKRLNNAMSPKTPTPSKARTPNRRNSGNHGNTRAGNHGNTARTPRRRTLVEMTPRDNNHEPSMYSPFCIDTPSKTPSKIRMGTKSPRRVYMSSPGTFQKDLEAVNEGMKTLTQLGENIGQRRTRRSSMGVSSLTTPQRPARQKPIFV